MKNNFRKAALSTVCMLVVAILSLTGVTYAWFTAGENAVVNGMNVTVATAEGGVQVRGENAPGEWSTTWQNELNLNVNANSIKPVSSADAIHFFTIDEVNPENANQYTVISVDKATDSNIIVKKFQLSNPGADAIQVNLTGSTIENANQDASVKPIYQAARVALIVTGGENSVTYYLGATEGDSWNGFTATADENNYATLGTTGSAKTTNTFEGCVINLPANPDNGDLTENKVVTVELVLWLEGQDADCTNANASGAFEVNLNFQKVTASND